MEIESLIKLSEPTLLVGHGQFIEDPRDGLSLFGPLDQGKPYGVRAGVIGTSEGIRIYKDWVTKISRPIIDFDKKGRPKTFRPIFPGFKSAFGIEWDPEPFHTIVIPDGEIEQHVFLDDAH